MSMKKNSRFNAGISLIEIAVAILFFAFAAIPIYYALSFGASQDVDIAKVALANSIMASFREEVMNLPYDTEPNNAIELFNPTTSWGPVQATPQLFQALLLAQKKYKDFKFDCEARISPVSPVPALEFRAELSWSNANAKGLTKREKISFIKVKR